MLAAQGAPSPMILTLPVSVRSAGLGGAGVGLSGDASAVFLNPAGLATIRNIAIEAAAQRYPDGSLEGMAAGAFRFFQLDVGGGVHYLQLSDTSGVASNLEWVGSVVYRYGLIAVGSGLRYVSMRDTTGVVRRAATIDAGLGIHVFDLMTLAFAVRSLADWRVTGTQMFLPTRKTASFTFNFVDPQETARLLATVDVVWQERSERRTVVGVEAGGVFGKVGVVGRLGYGAAPESSGQKEFSLGAGVVLSRVNLDYAWQRRTRLGREVHRLGVRFTL